MVTLASDPQIDLFPPGDAARLTTPDAQMVLDALADPKWDFRTIGGIAKENRLSDECVSEILSSFRNSSGDPYSRILKAAPSIR